MLSYTSPLATVQHILQKQYRAVGSLQNQHVKKVLHRLSICRTAALGYHVYRCSDEDCAEIKYRYHSCRDRHCPQCGALKKDEWIEARMQELIPVKYYHVVFTLPHELNSLIMGHRKVLYKLLFDASARTLPRFAKDEKYLGATPGIISILHTWGQQLSFHPHIHCIVSGGGISSGNEWKYAKKNQYGFLFPVKAMAQVFKAKFPHTLKLFITNNTVTKQAGTDIAALLKTLWQKDWLIYAKAPFGGPQTVIEYLGRYTHKVAISNHRLIAIDENDGAVTFDYKDYADGNRKKQLILKGNEFIRRFEQHILPKRFTKIRTYGYLSNRNRHQRINEVLRKMKLPLHKGIIKIPLGLRMMERFGINIKQCPCCKQPTLELLKIFYPWKLVDDG